MAASDPYPLEELEQHLYELAVKLHDMKALEQAIDQFWAEFALEAIPLVGPYFAALYEKFSSEQGAVVSSGDYPVLEGLPNRCRNIVGIDPTTFTEAQGIFEPVAMDMVGIEGAPGNMLTKIGSWYGDAAEAFEDYFAGYAPAQARQAELFAATINSCASLEELAVQSKLAVKELLQQSLELADKMITTYKETQKALKINAVIAVVGIAAAGFGAAAAAGAAALSSAAAGGVSALLSSTYSFDQVYTQLAASDSASLIDTFNEHLVKVETAITQADDEISGEIERLREGWTMSQVTIPAPPGSDEVGIDGFHHESSL
jgi:L-lactate utilization protein LutC